MRMRHVLIDGYEYICRSTVHMNARKDCVKYAGEVKAPLRMNLLIKPTIQHTCMKLSIIIFEKIRCLVMRLKYCFTSKC